MGEALNPDAMVGLVGSYVFNYCLFVICWEQWIFDGEQGEIKASSTSVHVLPDAAALQLAFFATRSSLCILQNGSIDKTAVRFVTLSCDVDHLYISH